MRLRAGVRDIGAENNLKFPLYNIRLSVYVGRAVRETKTTGKEKTMKTIIGNTYPVKEQLKALGGRWNSVAGGWDVPDEKEEEAKKLVASAPVSSRGNYGGGGRRRFCCQDCGDTVYSGTRCWETGLTH